MAEPETQTIPEAYVLGPDGKPEKLIGEDAIRVAGAGGAKFITPQEASARAYDDQEQARVEAEFSAPERFGLGALDAVTLGAAGPLMMGAVGALGGDAASAGRDLAAIRGTTAGQLGYGAGVIAPALLGDEAGLLGATPMGALGRLGGGVERFAAGVLPETVGVLGSAARQSVALASRGAVEAGMLNMSDTASDAILRNKPLSAQALAGSFTNGALMGGIVGGGIGAVLGGVQGAAANRMTRSLSEAADELGASATAGRELTVKEAYTLKSLGATGEDIQRIKSSGQSFKEALEGYGAVIESKGGRIADIGKPDRVARMAKETAAESYQQRLAAAREFDRVAPGAAPDLERIRVRLADMAQEKFAGTYEYKDVVRAIRREHSKLQSLGEQPGIERWVKSRDQIAESLTGTSGLQKTVRSEILNIIDDEIRNAMQGPLVVTSEAKAAAKAYAGATAMQRAAEELETMAGRKLQAAFQGSSGFVTGGDLAAGAGITALGHPVNAAGYVAARSLGRAAQRYIEPFLVEWAYRSAVGSKAAAATRTAQETVSSAVKDFFKSGQKAAGRGVSVAARATAVSGKPSTRKEFDKSMETTRDLLSPMHRERVKQFVAKMEAAGQAAMAENLLMTYDRAAAYLRHNLPVDNSTTGLGKPAKSLWLSQKEEQFNDLRQAVEDPMGTIEGIGDGTVTREQMLAIKYVYPDIYTEVVTNVAQEVAAMKERDGWLAPDKVVRLGIVLDAAVDETLESSYIGAVQASFAPPPEPQQGPPADQTVMGPDTQGMLTVAQKGMVG